MENNQLFQIPELKGLKKLLELYYKKDITLEELQQLIEAALQNKIKSTIDQLKPSEAQQLLTHIGYIDNQLTEEYKNNKGRNK